MNKAHDAYKDLIGFLRTRIDSPLPIIQGGEAVLQQLQGWAAVVFPQVDVGSGKIDLDIEKYKEWANSMLQVAPQTSIILAGILDAFLVYD